MDLELLHNIAMTKYNMSKNDPVRFFIRSIVAGLYLGMATILSYTLAVVLIESNPAMAKICFAGFFGIGLVAIVLLGSELFTGNCFTTMIPVYEGKLKFLDIIPAWIICYVGNFVGMALVMWLFAQTGSQQPALNEYVAGVCAGKLDFNAWQLFVKGILCNFIVCVAAFAGMKIKGEGCKSFVMIVVVMSFVLPGFEHSIANMGTFSLGFFTNGMAIQWSGLTLHMILSTLGNIVGGGVMLGLPIYLMNKPEK